jgi:hypothetical protein
VTPKIPLIRERHSAFYRETTKPLTSTLPFYERDGGGYVHRVRSGDMHYFRDTGKLTHTTVQFWCGAGYASIYPASKQPKRKGRVPGRLVREPSLGRVVCATCEGRAIGSGQLGEHKIGPHSVKYKPHSPFFGAKPNEAAP